MSYITEQERQEDFYQKQYKRIANGLNDFLARERLKKIDLCKTLGLHYTSAQKLLDAEPVGLDMVRLLKIISLAGYKVVKKEEEKLSMTREQKKYWRKSAVCFSLVIILCIGIVYGVCHLVNVAM